MNIYSCYLFQGISKAQLQSIERSQREIQMEKDQWIFQEGQKAEDLYILRSGAVELTAKLEEGFEIPITKLQEPGDCFGSSALIAPYIYSLSARCMKEGALLSIKQATLQKLISEDRDLGCTVMTNLAGNLLARLVETRQEVKIHFKTLFKSMHS